MSQIRVREATPGDNEALLRLSRKCPMTADISLSIERDPDFFALSRLRGEGSTYVAEREGRVVASGSVFRRPGYLFGAPATIGCVADLKVLPELRGRGLAGRIVRAIVDGESGDVTTPFMATAAAGNAGVERTVARLAGHCPVTRLGTFTSFQLLPVRIPQRPPRLDVRLATPADEDELASLLDAHHRQLAFAPVFRDGGFRRLLDLTPGLELESYRVARREGRLVAALAAWGESAVKRTRVRRLPGALRLASRLAAAASSLGVPRLPGEGELLRFVYLRHLAYAPGEEDALAALVHASLREARSAGLHFVLLTCQDDDPAADATRGLLRLRYRYSLFAGTVSERGRGLLEALARERLFDDAALA